MIDFVSIYKSLYNRNCVPPKGALERIGEAFSSQVNIAKWDEADERIYFDSIANTDNHGEQYLLIGSIIFSGQKYRFEVERKYCFDGKKPDSIKAISWNRDK
jgi:hypothetical protein